MSFRRGIVSRLATLGLLGSIPLLTSCGPDAASDAFLADRGTTVLGAILEADAQAHAAQIHANGNRDAARMYADSRVAPGALQNDQVVYEPITFTETRDFGGDGAIHPEDFLGKGKQRVQTGEPIRFGLYRRDHSARHPIHCEFQLLNEQGELVHTHSEQVPGYEFSQTGVVFEDSDPRGIYTGRWLVNGNHVGTSRILLVTE